MCMQMLATTPWVNGPLLSPAISDRKTASSRSAVPRGAPALPVSEHASDASRGAASSSRGSQWSRQSLSRTIDDDDEDGDDDDNDDDDDDGDV